MVTGESAASSAPDCTGRNGAHTAGPWWNYKQAADLPPEIVERMWRALDQIAEGANPSLKPGYAAYLNKAGIVAIAKKAAPNAADVSKAEGR